MLVEASTLSIPFASNYFDLVVSMDVLQHLPRPGGDQSAVAEISRILKPGGLFLLRTNSHCGYPPTKLSDYQRYSMPQISSLLLKSGFKIEISSYVNFLPGIMTTIRQLFTHPRGRDKDLGLTMTARPPSANLISRLEYFLLRAEAAYLAPTRPRLPFGHSILTLAAKSQ